MGKFLLPSPGGKRAQETCAGCPQQRCTPGRARQSSGTGPCGDCRRILWVPGPQCQYSGKIRLIEKPGVLRFPTVTGGQILDWTVVACHCH